MAFDQLLQRRAGEPRPPVPKDWNKRPGLLSGSFGRVHPPWGSTRDARLLIAHGMIDEGRALYWRLMGNDKPPPRETTACCLEHFRPPRADDRFARLLHLLPKCERLALESVLAFDRGDANAGPEALLEASTLTPASNSGAFALLLAWLAWSDVYLQVQILHRIGKEVEAGFVVGPVQGYARLLMRQHKPAWESFASGADAPMRTVEIYRSKFGVELNAAAADGLADTVKTYCLVGKALVLYDLCFDSEAIVEFRRAEGKLTGALREACRLFA